MTTDQVEIFWVCDVIVDVFSQHGCSFNKPYCQTLPRLLLSLFWSSFYLVFNVNMCVGLHVFMCVENGHNVGLILFLFCVTSFYTTMAQTETMIYKTPREGYSKETIFNAKYICKIGKGNAKA